MPNEALSRILSEMAFLAELNDENPFKVRAWKNAGEIFAELPEPVEELVKSGGLTGIAGVGKGTQAIAKEYVETGAVKELGEMKKAFPPGLLELREVRGLGPKKIRLLYEQLNVGSLAELEYACEENRLVDIKGFGEKTQSAILKSIKEVRSYQGKVILPVALQEAEEVAEELSELKGIKRVEPTGELRRRCEVLSAIDFVVEGEGKSLEKAGFEEASGHWEKTSERGMKVRVWASAAKDFGKVWLETTGPEEFVKILGRVDGAATEEEIFNAKKKKTVPPECRDLDLSPSSLIQENDIKGVFHLHTTWSDGKNSLEEMVQEAERLGLEYLGVSDHSQTAFYAQGLDEKRVLQQKKEIEAVQKKHPKVRIFHGIESDILADGELDYPQSFLKNFDFVIASVHGQMKMSRADMTKRICGALANPATTWLGHWTGRILLGREAYDFDLDEAMKCAAKHGKAIELNANPYRLDIDWRLLPQAAKMGIGIGIHPDAHSAGGLADTKFGVWMARKAGLSANQVINTKSRTEMEKWLQERKP